MKKITALFFFLSSCTATQQAISQGKPHFHSEQKQRQKVIVLQKKFSAAQRALLRDQEEVELLRLQLFDAELDMVESQIDALEQKWRNNPDYLIRSLSSNASVLFLEEREKLHNIIQSGPGSTRAQGLLDRILQLITQVGDL